jgi:brefeldin A-resistance guanine nucleotide exchange factor 1
MRDQLYLALDVLRSLPSSVLNSVSEQLMAGVALILSVNGNKQRPAFAVVQSPTEWNLIISLFRATVSHPEASKVTLDIVTKLAKGNEEGALSVNNYNGIVALLDEFATNAGGAAAGRRQNGQKNAQISTL